MGKEYLQKSLVLGALPITDTVIFFDDFEGVLDWLKDGTGTDYVVKRTTARKDTGSFSLYLQTKATTPAAGDYVKAYKESYFTPAKRYIYQAMFRLPSVADLDKVEFTHHYRDGSNRHTISIIYLGPEVKWQYYDTTGTYADIPGGTQVLAGGKWYRLTLTVNLLIGEYEELVVGSTRIDMSGVRYYKIPDSTAEHLSIELAIANEGATQIDCYFDNIIIREA